MVLVTRGEASWLAGVFLWWVLLPLASFIPCLGAWRLCGSGGLLLPLGGCLSLWCSYPCWGFRCVGGYGSWRLCEEVGQVDRTVRSREF